LEILLFKKFSLELLQPASEALLALIFAESEAYRALVNKVVAVDHQHDANLQKRLWDCFNALTAEVVDIVASAPVFNRNLQSFLATVRLLVRKK